MSDLDYWTECVEIALDECGGTLTQEQIKAVAESIAGGHENYGMAFYSPPSSDRINAIEREWEAKLKTLQREYDEYRGNAETAVRRALRQHHNTPVSIGEYGEVHRTDGRYTRIQ